MLDESDYTGYCRSMLSPISQIDAVPSLVPQEMSCMLQKENTVKMLAYVGNIHRY